MYKYCTDLCAEYLLRTFNFNLNTDKYYTSYKGKEQINYTKNCLLNEGWVKINDKPQMGDAIVIKNNSMFICINDQEVMTYIPGKQKIITRPLNLGTIKYEVFRHPEIDAKVKALNNT